MLYYQWVDPRCTRATRLTALAAHRLKLSIWQYWRAFRPASGHTGLALFPQVWGSRLVAQLGQDRVVIAGPDSVDRRIAGGPALPHVAGAARHGPAGRAAVCPAVGLRLGRHM